MPTSFICPICTEIQKDNFYCEFVKIENEDDEQAQEGFKFFNLTCKKCEKNSKVSIKKEDDRPEYYKCSCGAFLIFKNDITGEI